MFATIQVTPPKQIRTIAHSNFNLSVFLFFVFCVIKVLT